MRLSKSYLKYYEPCEVYDDTGKVDCFVAKDGLLFLFDYNDIKFLLLNYPEDEGGWYFNNTRDRYIAEKGGQGLVTVNPQFVYENFKRILVI